jgi:uncharacterized protein YbcV (DUF1398 family)
MLTLEQIKTAAMKIKTGADFPTYIRELIELGVEGYETYVSDGHTVYVDADQHSLTSPPRYETVMIPLVSNAEKFKHDLKIHQQGQTDFPTFIKGCAESGIYKWEVSTKNMTCRYFDRNNQLILEEVIPQ